MQKMFVQILPSVQQVVREIEERKPTLPQYNYMKNLANGTMSIHEIVMSTLDVILAGTRTVSNVPVLCGWQRVTDSYYSYSKTVNVALTRFWGASLSEPKSV